MTTYAGLIAALLNPFDPQAAPAACLLISLLVMAVVAVAVGCVESLVARLRMHLVPRYLMLASALAALCLGAAGWLARS
jgi:formate hydrogenlyase subunit 4